MNASLAAVPIASNWQHWTQIGRHSTGQPHATAAELHGGDLLAAVIARVRDKKVAFLIDGDARRPVKLAGCLSS